MNIGHVLQGIEKENKSEPVYKTREETVEDITSLFREAGFRRKCYCACGPPDSKELEERGKHFFRQHIQKNMLLEFVSCLHFKKPIIYPVLFKNEGAVVVAEGFARVDPAYFCRRSVILDYTKQKGKVIGNFNNLLTMPQTRKDFLAHYETRLNPVAEIGLISYYVYGDNFNGYGRETQTNFACNFELEDSSKDKKPKNNSICSLLRDHKKTDFWGPALKLPPVVRSVSIKEMSEILTT